jgi:fibrillarin-like pre-rRNA processing protein
MKAKKIFPGVFKIGKKLFTENLVPGKKVYGEKLVKLNGIELREWNAFRSKIAAGILNGLKVFPIKKNQNILYLGAGEGTTISHLSDIIGKKGVIFAVEISARAMHKLIEVAEDRENIFPLLENALFPEKFEKELKNFKIDFLFQDISQKNQAQIFNLNAKKFLRKDCMALIALKAKSISQKKPFKEIIETELQELKKEFKILQVINLKPFHKFHALVLCKKS